MAGKSKVQGDEGNAPGGPEFESTKGPQSSGSDAQLGGQVQPETQTREDDGHRTFANPVRDPGPVLPEGFDWKHPDTSQGETIGSVNQPVQITQRHSTAPDWAGIENTMKTTMMPELTGAHSVASDIYNKEKGEGLTDMAKKKAAEPRQLAPTSGQPVDAPADKAPEPVAE